MEWLDKILKNVPNAEEICSKICSELPKNFIPKDKYNEVVEEKRILSQQQADANSSVIRNIALKYAVSALSDKMKIKDESLVKMLIDNESVTVDDYGVISGLDEQMYKIQNEKPYLFGEDPLTGKTPVLGDSNPCSISKEQFGKMGYRDRLELYNDNPELYKHLSNS